MYRIIGADGREYGPVSAEQLRRWIAEGRANASSRALLEGSSDWKPLGAFPEFSFLFTPTEPPTPPPYLRQPAPRRTNSLALAGMILGILALTLGLCCYGLPLNVLGLIFSVIGLLQIRSHPELYDGQGVAVAGVILCSVSLLLAFGIFLFFGAVAALGGMSEHMHRL